MKPSFNIYIPQHFRQNAASDTFYEFTITVTDKMIQTFYLQQSTRSVDCAALTWHTGAWQVGYNLVATLYCGSKISLFALSVLHNQQNK